MEKAMLRAALILRPMKRGEIMPGHSLSTLLCGILFVHLAWIGIVLVGMLHGRLLLVPVMLV
jgi:hypothetical protein